MAKFQLDSGKEIFSDDCLRLKDDYDGDSINNYERIKSTDVIKETDFYTSDHFESGDYNGSIVGLTNCRSILEEYPGIEGITQVHGSYSYKTLLIRLDVLNNNQDLQDLVFSLEDYPCLDDELLSELEQEAKEESLDDILHDFVRQLNDRFNYNFEALSNDFVSALFHELERDSNAEWYFEHTNAWFSVKNMLSRLDQPDILEAFKEVFHEYFDGSVNRIKGIE
jgi:hypothetical protein